MLGLIMVRLYLTRNIREAVLVLIVGLSFFISHEVSVPNLFKHSKVVMVKDYKVHVRNGFNVYELVGSHSFEINDRIHVNEYNLYSTRNQYQKSKRIVGSIELKDTHLVQRKWSLKKHLFSKMPPELKEFFDREVDSIFSVFSLQLLGLIKIVNFLSSKFLYKNQQEKLDILTILIYAYFIGLSFSVMRILVSRLFKKKEHYLCILLIMYPYSFYDMGFNLVYLPLILKSLSVYFKNVNFNTLRIFFLMRLFGSVQVLEFILYPVLKVYAGIIVLFTLLYRFDWALFFLQKGAIILNQPRLLIVGVPPLICLFFYLLKDLKTQIVVMALMQLFVTYQPWIDITMINVYQGDATLIRFPFNSFNVLVDTGRASSYRTLKRSLYKKGIKKIDYLVITHDDLDHSENKERLVQDFQVQYIIDSKEESVPFLIQHLKDKEYHDANGNSLVLELRLKDFSFLMMGDAGVMQEKDLIRNSPDLKIDVLKLGHHGSNTSTSMQLLETLRPKVALVSSEPKMYGHPHPEVMKRLYDLGIPVLQTSIEGDITIKILPFFNLVVSQSNAFGIMK